MDIFTSDCLYFTYEKSEICMYNNLFKFSHVYNIQYVNVSGFFPHVETVSWDVLSVIIKELTLC